MKTIRPLLSLPLVAGLLLAFPVTSEGARGKPAPQNRAGAVKHQVKPRTKHHHHHGLSGRVLHVHHSKVNKGHGSITIRVHHHIHRKNVALRAAVAVGLVKRSHKVRVHFHPATHFNVVGKGIVSKPQVKTVSRGKVKGKVVVPGKPHLKTLAIPTVSASVHKGQWVHVKFPNAVAHALHHASTVNIHVHKSLPAVQGKKANVPGKKAAN
jgi:hypothetical protein